MLQLFKLETEARRGRSPAAGLQEYNTHMRENELEQEIRRLKQVKNVALSIPRVIKTPISKLNVYLAQQRRYVRLDYFPISAYLITKLSHVSCVFMCHSLRVEVTALPLTVTKP